MNTGSILKWFHYINLQLIEICNKVTTLKLCNMLSVNGHDADFIS